MPDGHDSGGYQDPVSGARRSLFQMLARSGVRCGEVAVSGSRRSWFLVKGGSRFQVLGSHGFR